MDNLLREIESLKERISKLESGNKANLNIFGRSYSLVGNSDSDFLIKTKGLVKIQWGNKFIDLIKDGKIAGGNNKLIFEISDLSEIDQDGIYIIGESAYLKIGDNLPINLVGEVGSTYVSFMEGLETTSEAKYNALVNIGFIYKSIDLVTNTSLLNGVIYIESEQKFYIVKEGTLTEFKISIPNPFTELFIILKNDTSVGALVIKGEGLNNSIAFDSFYIFSDNNNAVIDANKSFAIKINGNKKITINSSEVNIGTTLSTNMITSEYATTLSGFRLYYINGKSILEVDQVIERDSNDSNILLYPEYWFLSNNIINSISSQSNNSEESENNEQPEISTRHSDNSLVITVTLRLECDYEIGDILCVYVLEEDINKSENTENGLEINSEETFEENVGEEEISEDITSPSIHKVELEVIDVSDNKMSFSAITSESINSDNFSKFSGKFLFLIKSISSKLPIRLKDNNLDIVEYGDKLEDRRNELIKTRVGNLSDIQDELNTLEGSGIYTDNLILGGFEVSNFPRYTKILNDLVSSINIENSDEYNCVLVSIGLLKLVLTENLETIDKLKQKVETIEADIIAIKQQLDPENTE